MKLLLASLLYPADIIAQEAGRCKFFRACLDKMVCGFLAKKMAGIRQKDACKRLYGHALGRSRGELKKKGYKIEAKMSFPLKIPNGFAIIPYDSGGWDILAAGILIFVSEIRRKQP